MRMMIETTRLLLREMTVDDAENTYLLNLDPDVIKYTGDKPFESIEAAAKFLQGYDHYKIYGFGRWAVVEKSTNNFLGWCGLKYSPALDEYDIGYRFLKKHWGKGFATESAAACMEAGFYKFNIQSIVGRAMPENLASIKVLEKIGLKFFEHRTTGGLEELIYKIERA